MCCSARHPGGRVTSLACPREVTKRRAPGWDAGAARRFATGGRGFADRPSWPAAKAARSLAPPRAVRGPDPSALRRPTRANVQSSKQRLLVPAFAGTTEVSCGSGLASRDFPLSRLRERVRVRARWEDLPPAPLLRPGRPRSALPGFPLGRGEDAEEKARRGARTMRARSLSGQGRPVSEPP